MRLRSIRRKDSFIEPLEHFLAADVFDFDLHSKRRRDTFSSKERHKIMMKRMQAFASLMLLSSLLGVLAGCARPSTQPAVPPTPTIAPGWERFVNPGPCGYVIDHPSNMDGANSGTYSWILSPTAAEPSGPVPNFIYISVIPDGFQSSEPGAIYNYEPAETQTLLNMQVGESTALRADPLLADWFTYTRLPDTALGDQAAQTYENTQPWEFPLGTKEIRYYLKANGCTYLVGGYMATVGSGQPGAMSQERFDEIMATFRVKP
jgi:hypothetical protein